MSDVRPMTELEVKMFGELYQLRTELAEARRQLEALKARQFKPYPDGPMPGPFGWEIKS